MPMADIVCAGPPTFALKERSPDRSAAQKSATRGGALASSLPRSRGATWITSWTSEPLSEQRLERNAEPFRRRCAIGEEGDVEWRIVGQHGV